ncbi:MAG: cadherin domain-containing protein, partial [Sulfurovum sp.]|nr:cadherin domain-containing protein [Sulfurovum sp.]
TFLVANNNLSDKQLHAFLSIITNQILSSPTGISSPTLTIDAPTQTIDNNVSIEVNGKAGSDLYLNGVNVGTIGSDGTFSLTLDLTLGENSFVLILKDAFGNESSPLDISVLYIDALQPLITLNGANPQFIEYNTSYIELGANASDYIDGDITNNIMIDSTNVDTNTLGDYNVTYDVTDSSNTSADTVTRTIEVRDTISPVFTSASSSTVVENQSTAITLVASDVRTITYSISGSDTSFFTLDANSGVITFTVDADYETQTSYSFIATASDGINETNQTVTIELIDIDDTAPVFISDDNVTVPENQTTAIILEASDANKVFYSISGPESTNFVVNTDTGVVEFTIVPNHEVKDRYIFIATASDGVNETNQTVTINISNVDDTAPVFTSTDTVTVAENQTNAIDLNATDANTIIYSITGIDSDAFNLNTSTGVVTFKVAPDYEGQRIYVFTAHASDGIQEENQDVTINISNVDDTAPVFTSDDNATVEENQRDAITLVATDAENTVNYSLQVSDDSSFFQVDSGTGVVTFRVDADYDTKVVYTFTAIASDGINSTNQVVTITLINLDDDAPVFTSEANVTVEENQNEAITLVATDENNVTYSISGGDSASFTVNEGSGVVLFSIVPDFETKDRYIFIATASDGVNETNQTVTINISNVDDTAPVFTSTDTVTVAENQTNAIDLNATDANTITYSISGIDSADFDINASSGMVTFKVAPDYETKIAYAFVATASDGINTIQQNVTINISNVDDTAPVFTSDDTVSVAENQTDAITLVATDANNISYSISGGASSDFDVNSSSGVVTFQVAPDFETLDTYSFRATATDEIGNSVTQEVTINVYDVQEAQAPKKTGQIKSYDKDGTEIIDDSLKDDGFYQAGIDYSYTRDDTEATVTDTITGLMWADDASVASVQKLWVTEDSYTLGNYFNTSGDTATGYCAALTLANYSDWRLPSRVELQGIVLDNEYDPAIDKNIFENTASGGYWSSTSRVFSTSNAWYVDFNDGASDDDAKNSSHYVRCVRVAE